MNAFHTFWLSCVFLDSNIFCSLSLNSMLPLVTLFYHRLYLLLVSTRGYPLFDSWRGGIQIKTDDGVQNKF